MDYFALAALGVVSVTSVALFVLGSRFTRRYIALNRAMPPLTWMFRRTSDPDMERSRRMALTFLPFYLIALVLYLFRP